MDFFNLDAVFLLRSGYLIASATILIIFFTEPLSSRFLSYGPRVITSTNVNNPSGSKGSTGAGRSVHPSSSTGLDKVFDHLATYRVPRSWFSQFYVYSVASSLFWGHQIWTQGPAFEYIVRHTKLSLPGATHTDQILLAWLLFLFQGIRRLLESIVFSKPSTSTLWILHWVMGIAFYTGMNVAVWIDGIPSLLQDPVNYKTTFDIWTTVRMNIIPCIMFAFATQVQFFAHRHLASLPSAPNYSIPTDKLFQRNLTPHYFAEYLIYLSLALVAAPPGYAANLTISSAAAFVLVNLAVTAHGTKKWYEDRFGKEKVSGKFRMIPGIW